MDDLTELAERRMRSRVAVSPRASRLGGCRKSRLPTSPRSTAASMRMHALASFSRRARSSSSRSGDEISGDAGSQAEGRCPVIPVYEVSTSDPGGEVACVDEIASPFRASRRESDAARRALDFAHARRRSMWPSRMIASVMGPVERSADRFHSLRPFRRAAPGRGVYSPPVPCREASSSG